MVLYGLKKVLVTVISKDYVNFAYMTLIFTTLAILGIVQFLVTLPVPDIKPFNCLHCLAFWISLPVFYLTGFPVYYSFAIFFIQWNLVKHF